MAVRLANIMTKKIPLAIDAKPFAQAIDKSVRKTMTKHVMTKSMICVIDGALVGLAVVITWGMLVALFSL
jgi:hypothetical protein